jgi:hypothetical protein
VKGSERFLDLAMRPNQSTGVPVGEYTGTAGLMKPFARVPRSGWEPAHQIDTIAPVPLARLDRMPAAPARTPEQ